MTIGVDASRSVSTIQKTGVELVSDELLKTISNQQPAISNQGIIFYTPEKIACLPLENQRILRWPFKFLWTQIRLAWELIFHPPEAMFFPVHAMPLILIFISICSHITGPISIPRFYVGTGHCPVPTKFFHIIHDIAFKKQPKLYSFKQKIILNLDLWLAQKICAKIFVPTKAVKDDLLQYTKINPEKIIVTPWGYRVKTQNAINKIQKKKQLLYLGRVEEKKNIGNLIKCFQIFNKKYPDYKLILAGKVDSKFPISNFQFPNKSQITNSKPHNTSYIIHNTLEFLGFVSEDKKRELLSESTALIHVPFEEGFGFPILEAFDFGLPVIASDIAVLREIGGDACAYVDPDSPSDIASGLEKIIVDEKLQTALITAGQERLKEFDWSKTTEQIINEIISK